MPDFSGTRQTTEDLGPTSAYLAALQTQAEKEGRVCVVGGLIVNPQGQIFVQKRAPDRPLFPGCWDIAGGHVEPGEGLYEALAREIEEETGWRLTQIVVLVEIFDWEATQAQQKQREFDFIVEVEGESTQPRLEAGKFTEFRWVGPEQVALLRENRVADDLVIFNLVQKALALQ